MFPQTMADRTDGFGVAKLISRFEDGSWDAQYYSNYYEDLEGTFSPIWLNNEGHWYVNNDKYVTSDTPMLTSKYYPNKIQTSLMADVGFSLTHNFRIPEQTLKRIENHPKYGWSRSPRSEALPTVEDS